MTKIIKILNYPALIIAIVLLLLGILGLIASAMIGRGMDKYGGEMADGIAFLLLVGLTIYYFFGVAIFGSSILKKYPRPKQIWMIFNGLLFAILPGLIYFYIRYIL